MEDYLVNFFAAKGSESPFRNVPHSYGYNTVISLLLGDCLTWNATIAIWNPKLPDQIGTLIDRFCPEISAKEYILNITTRKIVIR